MRRGASGAPLASRGVALLAVLWIVAALSVVVAGMLQSVRDEVRVVSAARDTLQAGARGQAAIVLVLQELAANPTPQARLREVVVSYQNQPISVTIQPLNGLININSASEALLAKLFSISGQLDPVAANTLAQRVVQERSTGDNRTMTGGFEATEDLLRVPGLDYTLYAKISGLITADLQGGGRVNPLAARADVLGVLADGNFERAGRMAADRDAGLAGIDTTTLVGEFVDNAASQHFRLQARVPLADGRWLLSVRWVQMRQGMPDGPPWQIFRSEDRFEAPRVQGI